jgi:predicted HTH transcriptional regulator
VEMTLRDLIAEGEHKTLDFKYAINDSKKITRSLTAFTNTDGRRLLKTIYGLIFQTTKPLP